MTENGTKARRRRMWVVAMLVVLAGSAGVAFWATRRDEPLQVIRPGGPQQQGDEEILDDPVDADYVIVGGIRRKRSEVEAGRRGAKPAAEADQPTGRDPFDYGTTPPVKVTKESNPQLRYVAKVIRNAKGDPIAYARAVSVLAHSEPFDRAAYQNNPRAYLERPEPARVWQTAQPGEGVRRLARVGTYFRQIEQGDSTRLRVRGEPGMPVTFTSFDLGQFENQLTTITVEANASGIAETQFTAPPGTIARTNILAGSPATSGQVKFIVNTVLPGGGAAEVE